MFLKRNGETCEHPVPGFPGLLTDSEQKAYTEALDSVEKFLREFNEGAAALSAVEKQLPKIGKLVAEPAAEDMESVTIRGQDSVWQIRHTLYKSTRNELLLCTREDGQEIKYGIVERFAHNSVYAQLNGNTDLLMTSNQLSLLLQDYLDGERRNLQNFQKDIEVTAEETLAEKFPSLDHSRVVKAISARCGEQTSAKNGQAPGEKQTRNVRVRF